MGDPLAPQSLAEGLRIAIDRAGLTHDDVARRAGLGVSTLRNYLQRGDDVRIPTADVLRRITRVLADAIEAGGDTFVEELWSLFGRLLDHAPYEPDPGVILEARQRVRRRGR